MVFICIIINRFGLKAITYLEGKITWWFYQSRAEGVFCVCYVFTNKHKRSLLFIAIARAHIHYKIPFIVRFAEIVHHLQSTNFIINIFDKAIEECTDTYS